MTNNTYTIFARFPDFDCIEEVDVEAPDREEAIRKATKELDDDYAPGYTIIACEQRIGLFI